MPMREDWRVYPQPHGGIYVENGECQNICVIPPTWTHIPRDQRIDLAHKIAALPKLMNALADLTSMIRQGGVHWAATPAEHAEINKARELLLSLGYKL